MDFCLFAALFLPEQIWELQEVASVRPVGVLALQALILEARDWVVLVEGRVALLVVPLVRVAVLLGD